MYEISEMADILNIGESIFDDHRQSIVKFEFHTYNPSVNMTFGHIATK